MSRRIIVKALSVVCLGCLLFAGKTVAQETLPMKTDLGDTLDAFRTPTSPAFVLLGVEPTSVERPTTPRGVALSLLSSGLVNGVIPNNYAVEFCPYWLSNHPDLTYSDYVNASIGDQVVQSLSLSLVASQAQSAPDSGSDIGAGIRFQIHEGGKSARMVMLEESLARVTKELSLEMIKDKPDTVRVNRLTDSTTTLSLEIQDQMRNRSGLVLEMAGAVAGYFPQNNMDQGRIVHGGVWATLSYRPEATSLQFLAVGRLIWNNSVGGDGNYFDAGGRLVWQNGTLLLSGEFVERTTFNTASQPNATGSTVGVITFSNTYRASLLVEYRISRDMALQYAFGHNFTQVSGVNNLISQLGVKLGFGG